VNEVSSTPDEFVEDNEGSDVDNGSSNAQEDNLGIEIPEKTKQKCQEKDQELINQRSKLLPEEINKILQEKFRAEFVSIEKIDSDLLI